MQPHDTVPCMPVQYVPVHALCTCCSSAKQSIRKSYFTPPVIPSLALYRPPLEISLDEERP